MPILNFKSCYAAAIESGTKRQTIRRPRKRPIKVGDELFLYTGLRTKLVRKLKIKGQYMKTLFAYVYCDPICTQVGTVSFDPPLGIIVDGRRLYFKDAHAFAVADGFQTVPGMMSFFLETYPEDFYKTTFNYIRWRGGKDDQDRDISRIW